MSENSKDKSDVDGAMAIYEDIVNAVDSGKVNIDQLLCDLKRTDATGQFLCSTARFLAAVDKETYSEFIPSLVECAIEKDREHRYIGHLLKAVWGDDYAERAEELCGKDDTFRRVYKRVFATGTFD